MESLPDGYRALVIGASGGIGAALVATLDSDPRCARVDALHRRSPIAVDFDREDSIAAAAAALSPQRPYHLIVNAAGVLHTPDFMPEKSLAALAYGPLQATFRVNTIGPALVLRHFTPLLDRDRGLLASLSARVGSIDDNRLGGWYGYRASKAALNMIVKTAAIELRRSAPGAIVVALHPGTVETALSKPFRGGGAGRPAAEAARDLLATLDRLQPSDSGRFIAYDGRPIAW